MTLNDTRIYVNLSENLAEAEKGPLHLFHESRNGIAPLTFLHAVHWISGRGHFYLRLFLSASFRTLGIACLLVESQNFFSLKRNWAPTLRSTCRDRPRLFFALPCLIGVLRLRSLVHDGFFWLLGVALISMDGPL